MATEAPVNAKTKKCFKCGKIKPLTDFYKHPRMADGRVNKCKECNKKDVQDNYQVNIEHFREYDRGRLNLLHRIKMREDYAKTEQGLASGNRAKKAWINRNPEKREAHTILEYAVKSGKIKKLPCEVCGSIKRIHGHHNDYNKPLEVIWLCPKHHKEYHKTNADCFEAF